MTNGDFCFGNRHFYFHHYFWIMTHQLIEDQEFDQVDFSINPLIKSTYESCIFKNGNLSDCNLSYFTFNECLFENCNLSNANLNNTSFKDSRFVQCKMLGLQFFECKQFLLSFEFDECLLDYASFYNVQMPKTKFLNCSLKEVDFIQANLSGGKLTNCQLAGALFENTNLEKADLRGSAGYQIDPNQNNIKKALFSMSDVLELLYRLDIKIS